MAKKKKIKIVNRQKEMIERIKRQADNPFVLEKEIYQDIYDVLIDIYSLIQEHKISNEAEGLSDLGFALLYIEPWLDALKRELSEETNYEQTTDK